MNFTLEKYLKGDKVIWAIVIILTLFSIVLAYSLSSNLAMRLTDGDATPYLMKHAAILVLGFVFIIYFQHFKFKYFSRLSQLGVWASAVLLLITLLFGVNKGNASRWIMGFQPSDLAKIVLIIYVARLLAFNQDKVKDFKTGLLPMLIPIGIICLLILPADFSTAFMLGVVCFVLLFVGGVAIKHLAAIVGGAVAVFGLMLALNYISPGLLPRVETWKERLFDYNSGDEKENYQAQRAKLAVANGGIINFSPGKGSIKNELYSVQSDFAYAGIIEEYGSLFGGLCIMLLYLVLLFRSIKIMTNTDSKFGGFVVFGLSFMLVFQAFINMGVGVNLLPVTGQPLPLLSMGGTSILFTCISIGIILNVSRTVYKDGDEQ